MIKDNISFKQEITDNYDTENLTLKDFIEVCDKLKLPVFEVEVTINPFEAPHRRVKSKMYENMSEFRKTMPEWSARNYDYSKDCATYYLSYDGIANGSFTVRADNKSSSHEWQFEVVGQCVVVHTMFSYDD